MNDYLLRKNPNTHKQDIQRFKAAKNINYALEIASNLTWPGTFSDNQKKNGPNGEQRWRFVKNFETAYKYFNEYLLKDYTYDDLDTLYEVLHKIEFIVLTINQENIAFSFFERQNARGTELTAVDLLKNLLHEEMFKDEGWQQNTLDKDWSIIVENAKASQKSAVNIEQLLLYFYWANYNHTTKKRLYGVLKPRFKDNPQAELEKLKEFSEFYSLFVSKEKTTSHIMTFMGQELPELQTSNKRQIITTAFEALKFFDLRVLIPLIWCAIKNCKSTITFYKDTYKKFSTVSNNTGDEEIEDLYERLREKKLIPKIIQKKFDEVFENCKDGNLNYKLINTVLRDDNKGKYDSKNKNSKIKQECNKAQSNVIDSFIDLIEVLEKFHYVTVKISSVKITQFQDEYIRYCKKFREKKNDFIDLKEGLVTYLSSERGNFEDIYRARFDLSTNLIYSNDPDKKKYIRYFFDRIIKFNPYFTRKTGEKGFFNAEKVSEPPGWNDANHTFDFKEHDTIEHFFPQSLGKEKVEPNNELLINKVGNLFSLFYKINGFVDKDLPDQKLLKFHGVKSGYKSETPLGDFLEFTELYGKSTLKGASKEPQLKKFWEHRTKYLVDLSFTVCFNFGGGLEDERLNTNNKFHELKNLMKNWPTLKTNNAQLEEVKKAISFLFVRRGLLYKDLKNSMHRQDFLNILKKVYPHVDTGKLDIN